MIMLRRLKVLRSLLTRSMQFATRADQTMDGDSSDRTAPARHLVVEKLSNREIVRVQGEEVMPYLQGLMTNDMHGMQGGLTAPGRDSMYTMFLNKGGRVLYDAIVYRTADPNTFLIECDKDVTSELRRHLRLYRVRRAIKVEDVSAQYCAWSAFDPAGGPVQAETLCAKGEIFTTPDPRLSDMGLRALTAPEITWPDMMRFISRGQTKISVVPPSADANYRLHRYRLGVGEGVHDLPPGKSFPLEANCDFLNGVSFRKGCYIGQELTARVFHTGIVRKRLMPLRVTTKVADEPKAIVSLAGRNVGNIRGVLNDQALALMRIEQVLNQQQLMVDGERCYAEMPKWWPSDVVAKAREVR